jgi:excisionase family DNA binding protein
MSEYIDDSFTLMKVEDVARTLRVSRSQVYNLTQKHRLPGMKVGKCIRFRKQALVDWMTAREKSAYGR